MKGAVQEEARVAYPSGGKGFSNEESARIISRLKNDLRHFPAVDSFLICKEAATAAGSQPGPNVLPVIRCLTNPKP